MTKLWQKDNIRLHPLIEKYTVGDDYLLDAALMPYDILGTRAHVLGLKKIGLLKTVESARVIKALDNLKKDWSAGKITIKITDEDCHTVIENYLTEKLPSVGPKIHIGRSRNDQVLTALRLYMKDKLNIIKKEVRLTAALLLKQARKYQSVPLPGYSHGQQAMLSSVGHYYSAYAEALMDDAEFCGAILNQIDKSPLGSAAGFGVALPLDRKFTAKELGFKNIQINSLYCQNSRGKFDSLYLEALTQIMLTLGRFANDMILFASQEFNYFSLPKNLTTGSSIMPQKNNPDGLEIMRGYVNIVIANQLAVKENSKNPLSGYNRDSQLNKKPLLESVDIVLTSLPVVRLYLQNIRPNQKIIESKISPGIFAADIANELVKTKKIPFRQAYQLALSQIANYQINPAKNLASKISLGAPGNLDLTGYKKRLAKN
ncbi:MAG: argininosuccinate lyase [Candidatus Magasanikbacteria bacterium CG10_big_fil_rev_8_21_14_0_10_40_10]|uniref:Argininosuccinate lyase n=1 Tax=Candidatus Magasanikbacteria bacterium CG10_big_fil_rev_8_21_14_0_10_40_10 TaxID=1974648 RepID=A0A2M6W3T5_9BACT|nr:MAG: argininosuccinate lyase [Candidatus Magasanikbacteria bacterium CG10_big_fil_rev_8_21_14_0_10_40_10]